MRVERPLIDRIRDYFLSLTEDQFDQRFEWGKYKFKYVAKYETIKTLSERFNCPKTSLYIPLKELAKEDGFAFHIRPTLFSYEIEADKIIIPSLLTNKK